MCKKFFLISFVLVFGLGVVAQGEIVNRYSFTDGDTAAIDSVSGKDGTLEGTATISGNKLVLDGAGAAWLPSDVLAADLESVTIEAWYTESHTGDIWSRLFDFGGTDSSGGGGYAMFCVPHQYGSTRFTVATNGFATWQTGEETVSGPIFTGEQTHVACVWDGPGAEIKIYLNGVLQQASATTMDLSAILRENAYIGDSCYTGDAYMTGTVDEFRIYNTALTDAEVLDSFNAGPDAEISAEPAPKIVWVSEWNADADGVVYDQGWIDLLRAQGYVVDANTAGNYTVLTESKIAELESADMIIISRNSNSGNYATDVNEVTQWNSFKAPIIMTTAFISRSNRWQWIDSTAIVEYAPETLMDVVAVGHPVFAGVAIEAVDTLNIVDIIDETVDSGQNSFITATDVGNGTLLARRLDDGSIWIAEWAAGVNCYEGATQVPAGRRMLFTAGGGGGQAASSMNLNEDGQKMFLNAVDYMMAEPPAPVHSYNFEDGTTNDSVGDADGVLVGGAEVIDGAMVTFAQDQWMEMPGDVIDINSYDAVTIEAWYIPTAGANTGWSMLAYLGGSSEPNIAGVGINGYFMTTARADDKSRAAISTGSDTPWADETGADGVEYDDGLLHHMVSTLDSSEITLYIDGVLQAITPMDAHNSIQDLSNDYVLLAKGGYGGDPEWIGAIDEFNIYDKAMSAAEVMVSYAAGPKKVEPVGPSAEGLVAYYAMEGDAMDSSGNGLDGTLETIGDANDATAIFVAGVDGMAIDLLPSENGTKGPYVNCGADPLFDLTDAITVGAWANFRSVPDEWRAIVAKGDSAWRIGNVGATTALHFGFCGYGSRPTTHGIDGTIEVGFDSWHYVCGTYDITDGAKLYVDGVLDVEIADTAGIALNTYNVWIGGNEEDTGWKPYRLFDGMIDEVRIYDRALSADEVLALAGQ